MILLLMLLLLVAIGSVYFYFTRTFNYWKKRNVKGPEPVLFFGNIKDIALRKKNQSSVYKEIYDQYPHEKIVGIYRMTTPTLLIRDLDIVKMVMIKDFDMFSDRGIEFSEEGLGLNLFHADGDTWSLLRSRFSPIFTSGKLKNMFNLLDKCGNNFINYLLNNPKELDQELHGNLQKYTISAFVACAFGLNIDATDKKHVFLKKLDNMLFRPNFFIELDMMYPGILKTLNSSLFPKEVKGFFLDLVKVVVNERKGVPSKRNDFMDVILELRKHSSIESTKHSDHKKVILELSESVIAAQAFIFYAAGYETSSSTVGFLLHHLAFNPDIQNKLSTEIDEVLSKNGGELTYDSLWEMTYLAKVFDETLRMHPIVDNVQRNAKLNYMIPGTDVIVEKGRTVIVSLMAIHSDEKYYPNPEVFDPERFSPENIVTRPSIAYMPFGIGPRNCIGMRFAKIQSYVLVVKLLSKFRVETSKKTKTKVSYSPHRLVLNPDGDQFLKFVPRY